MRIAIVLLPILIFMFMFLAFVFSRHLDMNVIFRKIEGMNKKFPQNNQKPKFYEDLKLLMEHEGGIEIFRVKIKSVENILVLRILTASAFFIVLNLLGIMLSQNLLLWSLMGAAVMFFLPVAMIKGLIDRKAKSILFELPDVIEIISSLIKAGLTLDECINYVSKNYKGSISDLFALFEIKKLEGHTRSEAFKIISRLSFCNDFKTVIKIMAQSEEIGNPIAEVLNNLSKSLRDNQRDQLKIKAERLESNLVLIIFIFLFIPMLMIFLLPVLPQLKLLF
ncbi:MAG: type II secretion system F family protein [Actinomycetota bacterium]